MTPAKVNEIVIFMAVAEAGSFVRGGRSLGLTGSAASKAVARLEARLGVRLLHRNSRSVRVTEEGQALMEGGQRILDAIEQAEAAVAGPVGTPRGLLRLTVPDAFGRRMILPLVTRYLEAWPDVRVDMAFSDRTADIVAEGFDLAIRIGAETAPAGLMSRRIASYPVWLCAAPVYLAAQGTPSQAETLGRHDCILFRSGTLTQDWHADDPDGRLHKLPVRGRLRMDSAHAIRDAALAGQGIALLPAFLIDEDIAQKRLVRVLPDLELGTLRIVALYPSRRLLEPRVRRFIDFLAEELGRR
ncbi:LysR family transcriptional regulator [Salipiger manganoxidans]|uniref:LysR family transcriptional regulator n=1 Tax=Salipiger marinus TaxID=555512 RepID=UPI001E345256|nr:LysR family transcriptional regulator [Salipiger manganoxidans]MCD1617952.1 LysR family transcriptional regulator [Salipiger manganoxidans]